MSDPSNNLLVETGPTSVRLVVNAVCVAGLIALAPQSSFPVADAMAPEPVACASITLVTSTDRHMSELATVLAGTEHIDAAYLGEASDDGVAVFVLVRDHGTVDRDALFDIEEAFSEKAGTPVTLFVRAHQGRDLRAMAGRNLLFLRG